jgi:hypothetical protein
VAAVDRFIYLEVLGDDRSAEVGDETTGEDSSDQDPLPNLQSLLTRAINATSGDDGAASISALGNYLSKASASFDPRLYGKPKLSALLQSEPYLSVTGSGGAMKVRLKGPTKKATKSAAKKTAKKAQPSG